MKALSSKEYNLVCSQRRKRKQKRNYNNGNG